MVHLTPVIAGIRFPFCLMNAAGALSTSREELLALAYSESGAVVTKSITPISFLDPSASCGLENPGHEYYVGLLPELRRAGKPIIASVAGLTVEEFILTSQALAGAGADLIEINLNDPHVHTHLEPFDSAHRLNAILVALRYSVDVPLAVKLPPAVPLSLPGIADAIFDAGVPVAICHNVLANGGPSQAQAMLEAAQGRFEVIGVGGVATGIQALTVLRSGITAIQIGSAVVKEGVGVFARLKREIAESWEFTV